MAVHAHNENSFHKILDQLLNLQISIGGGVAIVTFSVELNLIAILPFWIQLTLCWNWQESFFGS